MSSPDDLTAEAIGRKHFSTARRGGYAKDEVESFLRDVAIVHQAALDRAEAAERRVLEEVDGDDQASSGPSVRGERQALARANAEGRRILEEAQREREQLHEKALEEASAIVSRARREAERRVREANVVARRIRSIAERRRDEMLAEVERRTESVDAHRRAALDRIGDMEVLLRTLRGEIEETAPADAVDGEEGGRGDNLKLVGAVDRPGEGHSVAKGTGVQPTPVFDEETGTESAAN